MATRQPFWKWHWWKSTGFYPYLQVMCYWSFDLMFKAKLKLESKNKKIQYRHQSAILKVTLVKIHRLLSIPTGNVLLKFWLDVQSQTKVRVQKQKNPISSPVGHFENDIAKINRLLSLHTSNMWLKFRLDIQSHTKESRNKKKSKMAARRPFWKWYLWKSIGFCPWPQTKFT